MKGYFVYMFIINIIMFCISGLLTTSGEEVSSIIESSFMDSQVDIIALFWYGIKNLPM